MQVKLKVLVGKSAGKEIAVPVSRFLIGRGKDCHMRPKSDAISRNHCAILTGDDKVVIRDLNSRNGTHVNDERIDGDCELKKGDKIRVGKLEFEIVLKESKKQETPKAPKPKAKAAEKEKKSDTGSIDFDVSEWLETDGAEQRQTEPETRQFQLDETDRVQLEQADAEGADEDDDDAKKKRTRPDKQKPGKLPDQPGAQAATSRDAAADMLKKFFDNR